VRDIPSRLIFARLDLGMRRASEQRIGFSLDVFERARSISRNSQEPEVFATHPKMAERSMSHRMSRRAAASRSESLKTFKKHSQHRATCAR
jgi:hypothetical protein